MSVIPSANDIQPVQPTKTKQEPNMFANIGMPPPLNREQFLNLHGYTRNSRFTQKAFNRLEQAYERYIERHTIAMIATQSGQIKQMKDFILKQAGPGREKDPAKIIEQGKKAIKIITDWQQFTGDIRLEHLPPAVKKFAAMTGGVMLRAYMEKNGIPLEAIYKPGGAAKAGFQGDRGRAAPAPPTTQPGFGAAMFRGGQPRPGVNPLQSPGGLPTAAQGSQLANQAATPRGTGPQLGRGLNSALPPSRPNPQSVNGGGPTQQAFDPKFEGRPPTRPIAPVQPEPTRTTGQTDLSNLNVGQVVITPDGKRWRFNGEVLVRIQ